MTHSAKISPKLFLSTVFTGWLILQCRI